ncbi:NACHT, LRR and PYD domains-containing protein 12-like [Chiloscyllium punctatum]|uniref:NACHT, LRR and PYD domains-containing protein 12-like n=1 Tax=Chiloscyllium punctatum TaxID=137246 RepID=UPI003B63240A
MAETTVQLNEEENSVTEKLCGNDTCNDIKPTDAANEYSARQPHPNETQENVKNVSDIPVRHGDYMDPYMREEFRNMTTDSASFLHNTETQDGVNVQLPQKTQQDKLQHCSGRHVKNLAKFFEQQIPQNELDKVKSAPANPNPKRDPKTTGRQQEENISISVPSDNMPPVARNSLFDTPGRIKRSVTDLTRQHKDYLRTKNENLTITGENRIIRRFPLSERYTKVTIVPSLGEQEQTKKSLKTTSMADGELWRKAEQNHREEIPLDRLLRKHCNQTGGTGATLIIGPSGFGKSTTIKKIIHGWAAGEMYREIDVIFPFKVQQLNSIEGETCLNELISDFFPNFTNYLDFLWNKPEKILFIFDDLDLFQKPIDFTEMPSDNDDGSQSFGPEHLCEISHIVCSLIKGQLLNGCSVLGTSSPWKLQALGKVETNQVVNILGFSAESRKQYFQRCSVAGQLASNTLDYIEQNEMLYAMCYIPGFCSVLCSILETQQKERAQIPAFTTCTRVFFTYFTCSMKKCYYEDVIVHEMILKLGSLAYWGICNETIVFKRGQFNQHKLYISNWISGFMMEIQDNYGIGYFFTHSTLKDFVAALFKCQSTPADQVKKILTEWHNCTDDRFKFVSRFFIGLSSPNSLKQIGFYWGELHSETASNVSEWLREKFNSYVHNLESERNQKGLLEILYCLLEFGDATLLKAVLTPVKTLRFTKYHLQSFDCMVLSKALMMVQEIEELDLDNCGIGNEGIHQLESVLRKCEVLSLKSNNLTDCCVETLISALRENTVLLKLDVSNDDQNDGNANRLTDKSIHALSQFIQNSTQIKEIRLMNNQFSEEGLQRLKSIPVSNDLTVISE